jgi:DNA repair protein RadC
MNVREIVLAYRARPSSVAIDSSQRLSTPHEAAVVFTALLSEEAVEVFGMLCLTTTHRLHAYYEVSRGSLDATIVHPRDVFKVALIANTAAVIFGHNHPSGDPSPSPADRELTRRLASAGTLLGVEVLDHIVVGHDGQYFSFKEAGGL